MEGSFVKKPNPLLFLMFLLMATAGCHHKPVKAIVLIPTTDNELPSVNAEAGGVVGIQDGRRNSSKLELCRFSFRGRSAIQATSWKEAIRNQ